MLNNMSNITSIKRILLVSSNEYKSKKLDFKSPYIYNELIFQFSGKSIVNFNNTTLTVQANTLRFLPKGEVFQYTVDRIVKGDCIDIIFDTDTEIFSEPCVKSVEDDKKIAQLFKQAFSFWSAKNDDYYYKSMSILYEILSRIDKNGYTSSNIFSKIKPAVDYISAHYSKEEISIPYLASICNISESYLNKIFIKKYGLSPKKYIKNLKMNYALDILLSQTASISNIADRVGYENIYYFSKDFKKHFGLSPT